MNPDVISACAGAAIAVLAGGMIWAQLHDWWHR